MAAHGKGYQTSRIVVNVTPEQAAAVDEALDKEIALHTRWYEEDPEHRQPPPSRNDLLLRSLASLCAVSNIDWPEHVKMQGQRGKDGKFTKSS